MNEDRCPSCYELESECICLDLDTEDKGTVFLPGDEAALNNAIDAHVTRTPPHPFDGDE